MRKIALIVGGLILVGIAAWLLLGQKQATAPAVATYKDLVRVFSPLPDDIVASPLTVCGEARGNWFFAASFPVRLLDANGAELAVIPAQAKDEWMTTDFVPFEVTLVFQPPSTDTGTLILEKDNPSGLPEHADEFRIPVRF